jgi:DNA-binding CsgD family transcriptional regulator
MVGFDITPYVWPTDITDNLLLMLKRHNIFHGFTFYKRTDEYVEHWSFCTEPNNTQIYSLYFQQKDLLWKFVQYFCNNAQDLIDHTDTKKLGTYKNGSNIQQKHGFLTNESINKYLQFIETKGLFVKNNRNWAHITNFEKKLLQNLAHGFSQQDVAGKMGISQSLLQNTLNDLKLKLGVISLRDLELTQILAGESVSSDP